MSVTKLMIWITSWFAFHKGQEYPAIVEFAPFQKVSKKKLKKKDAKAGSIEEGIGVLKYTFIECIGFFVIRNNPKAYFFFY